jgi:two-component system sensor histidine kinase KdpD
VSSPAAQNAGRWISAALLLAAIVCAYHFLARANTTTVALTLLLLVLVLARWGLRYAVVTSIAATLCYNFFFLPPVGTLTIADPQNWLTLFAFLATSVVGSRLAEQARREAKQARARQQELEVLYRLSRELLQAEDVASLLTTIAPAVLQVAGASCVALLSSDDRTFHAGAPLSDEQLQRAQ